MGAASRRATIRGCRQAMSQSKALCDDFTQNFNRPDLQWQHLRTPEATAAYIASFS